MGCLTTQPKDNKQLPSNETQPHNLNHPLQTQTQQHPSHNNQPNYIPQQPPPQKSAISAINTNHQNAGSGIYYAAPRDLPVNSVIHNQRSAIGVDQIHIQQAGPSGLIDKDPAPPQSGIVADLHRTDGSRKVVSAVQALHGTNISNHRQIIQPKQNSPYKHIRQTHQQQLDIVHNEGTVSFAPPVRNINFHIHIG